MNSEITLMTTSSDAMREFEKLMDEKLECLLWNNDVVAVAVSQALDRLKAEGYGPDRAREKIRGAMIQELMAAHEHHEHEVGARADFHSEHFQTLLGNIR